MRLELCRNYATSYVKKTEVEVLPVVDFVPKPAFFWGGGGGDATHVYVQMLPAEAEIMGLP